MSFSWSYIENLKVYPSSRIHTDAESLPGNSGGAVIDKNFNLVGFLASGDGNYNEIVPIKKSRNIMKGNIESRSSGESQARETLKQITRMNNIDRGSKALYRSLSQPISVSLTNLFSVSFVRLC